MVDKVMTSRIERVGEVFGRLETEIMLEVDRRLALFLGIAR
jgi:mRNA interferase MazF